MRLRSFPFRSLRSPFAPRVASLAAVSVLLVAAPARADECGDDADCGFGFACVTVVTSVASTGTGGVGGASGEGGAAGFAGGAAPRGGGAGVGVGGTTGTSGVGGTASPPTACGNRFCETPTESPETCPLDCAFTTICATAMCSSDSQCAPGYVCPTVGGLAAGGAGGVVFCGDLLCSVGETMATCDVDCAPNLRRCTPGYRYCASNADCALGYRCSFSGWLGTGGVSGEADVTGGTFTGGSSGGTGVGGGWSASVGRDER
jgi:hypothetical protein